MDQLELQRALKKLPPELREAIVKGVKQAEDGPMDPGEAARKLAGLAITAASGPMSAPAAILGAVPAVVSIILERTEHRLRRRIKRRMRRVERALDRGDIDKAKRIAERVARAEDRLERLLARK